MRTDKDLTPDQWKIREKAEADLVSFIRLVAPYNVMGAVHEELCEWWTRQEALDHQLVLLPRDHGKSRYMAFRAAWWLTKYPDTRILYISSTATLAKKQLGFIKQLLESRVYQKYWPEMIHPDEGKRSKWTENEIEVDHPLRKLEAIRDPSVFTAGLTTSIVGLHFDIAILDDVVVYENAYTEEGRSKVHSQYSLLSSIESGDGQEWAVGTRYHPLDLYGDMQKLEREVFDKDGNLTHTIPVYEIFERVVEDEGDGTGQFLWPRQMRSDGKWFGFDANILATKRAKYIDKTQYRAQYYNDPNSGDENGISRELFQYYDKEHLKYRGGKWYHQNDRLNVIASMDLSYSTTERADYTSIVVLGIDADRNYFVLDVIRFKTVNIKEYYLKLLDAYKKWDFHKIVIETVAAQEAIVKELKNQYLRPNGIMVGVIEVKPTRWRGRKEDWIASVLEPIYLNNAVFHYRGGNCQVLEDEIVLQFPPHDDCKDALANAVENITPPTSMRSRENDGKQNVVYHPRFGGVMSA